MVNCPNHDSCRNNALCKLCEDMALLSLPSQRSSSKSKGRRQGHRLEKQAAKPLNRTNLPTSRTFKARPHVFSKGTKQITISKQEIEDHTLAEHMEERFPAMNFAFDKHGPVYCIMDYDILVGLLRQDGDRIRPTINSGTFWFDKADLEVGDLLVETKDTSADDKIAIHQSWLEKIAAEAQEKRKTPCLVFRFKQRRKLWAVIRQEDLPHILMPS